MKYETTSRTAASDRLFIPQFDNFLTFSYVDDRDIQSIDLCRAFTKTRKHGLADLDSKQARNPRQHTASQPSSNFHQSCSSALLVVRITPPLHPKLVSSLSPPGPTPTEIHVFWRQSKSMHGVMCTIASLAALQIAYSSSVSAGLHSIA